MPREGFLRRVGVATRWPAGVALTSWRYMWRTTPMRRLEESGRWEEDAPPEIPAGVDRTHLQGVADGAGPLFHRRYQVAIDDSAKSPQELITQLCENPDRASPSEFATFRKTRGADGQMAVGDEYVVRMPGPWDGPVRVLERTPMSFRFATLDGHLEAGQIRFSAEGAEPVRVTIESWARGGDRLSNILFDRLRMSKEVQLHMWSSFLERVVKLSGGTRTGALSIHTRRVAPDDLMPERRLGDRRAQAALDGLHERTVNFDVESAVSDPPPEGWRVDEHCRPMPPERPGPPEPGGSWEVAQRLMAKYEFADPRMIRAVYRDDSPLNGRDMLLEARFLGLRFHFGVRVGGVIDESREVDGSGVRVWGWYYETLQGHFEMGRMRFELWKWLNDGTVEFRIHVVSRPAAIRNPIIGWGFRLFGRSQQLKFARRACERMARLTAEELGHDGGGRPLPRASDQIEVGAGRRTTDS